MNQINLISDCQKIEKRAYVYSGYSKPDHNIADQIRHDVYRVNSAKNHRFGVVPNDQRSASSVPLNTGKVSIGLAYVPKRNLVAADQEWLQGVLLKHAEPAIKPLSDTVLWWLYGAAIVVIALTA